MQRLPTKFYTLLSQQEPIACEIGRRIDDRRQEVVEDFAYTVPLLDSLEAFIQVDDVMKEVLFSGQIYTGLNPVKVA